MDEGKAKGNLNKVRNMAKQAKSKVGQAKLALSFGKKISKHWIIILIAVIFDVFALIPFVAVIFNLTFALILFLYFGSKKKKSGTDNFIGIVLPQVLGNMLDWILSIIPVNVGTVLIRIFLSGDESEEQKKVSQEVAV
jgi:hypothetical protein